MTAIIFAVLPLVVSMLTGLIKRVPAIDNTTNQGTRNLVIRTIAALLSLGGVVGSFMVTGTLPDETALGEIVTVLAVSFATLLGSFGAHEVASK